MRTALYILLFANLAFFAWAGWIDAPPRAQAMQVASRLPQLVLASAGRAQSNSALSASPAAAANIQTAPGMQRCVSVGPFNTLERAASAASLLRERGLDPRQREEPGETRDGYWVYVGGLRSAAEEARVLRTLEQAALYDARVMPGADAGRRISVGLFSERSRAERRARVLRRLGLEPEIGERRVPGTVYWVDLNLGATDSTVPTEELLSPGEPGARLEVRGCPAVRSAPASG